MAEKFHLPVTGDDIDVDAALQAFEEAERARLGIRAERQQWVDTMLKPEMKKTERDQVTILQAGLTAAQDFLVQGALSGLGYKVRQLDVPDNDALRYGKEFGNRGQCNPTYFTVGNLVKYLSKLRDQGMPTKDVIDNHIFLTAGACGPCRFGMYVTEYRKALRDAGFDGFRVMLFQQQGGLAQATGEDVGLEMNPPFFIGIIKAIVCGDVLNALGYRIRPYEVVPGATDKALEEAKKILYKALDERTNIFLALARCRKLFTSIEVDRLRPKPRVSIIGEFWAMTTEGDGNYHLQRFLESEGAENDIQLTTAWLLYNVWEVSRDTRERRDLRGLDGGAYGLEATGDGLGVAKRLAAMRVAEAALRVGFQLFAQPVGLHGYHLPDMEKVAEVAKGFYSNDLRGGEGHMEVGKLILNTMLSKAHLTVSVKPFGCMPSSGVSDGVQSLITSRFPGTLFCAVETSGDGAANFYSRVQMFLYKARQSAENELAKAFEDTGITEAQVRAFLSRNPRYASALHMPPHTVAGTAANLVYEVAPLITRSAAARATARARRAAASVGATIRSIPERVRAAQAFVTAPETKERVVEDARVVWDFARGKVKERLDPLLTKLH